MQRFGLIRCTVALNSEGHRLQCAQSRQHLRHLIGLHCKDCLTQAVQFLHHLGRVGLHAVLHVCLTAVEWYDIYIAAHHIVVIRVALTHLQSDAIPALQTEHGEVESIEGLRRVGRVLVGQRHHALLAREVASGVRPVAEVAKVVVAHLGVGHLHRCTVDAVIDGVVFQRGLINAVLVNVGVGAHVGGVLLIETVGQVDDLAHLSLLEQCGVTLTVNLLHLPAHGRQLE